MKDNADPFDKLEIDKIHIVLFPSVAPSAFPDAIQSLESAPTSLASPPSSVIGEAAADGPAELKPSISPTGSCQLAENERYIENITFHPLLI